MRTPLVMALLTGLAVCFPLAAAKARPLLRTDQVSIVYGQPKEPKHHPAYDELRQRGVLELLRTMLNPFRLPRRLTLELKSCDGEVDAYYQKDVATVCYEYVELIRQYAPKVGTPGGLIPADAIVAAVIDTFLHEGAHALIDMLKIPVLGREEDAADFFSAYILLRFPPQDAHRLIQGVGFLMASEAKAVMKEPPKPKTFADTHALLAQRHYNLLCMAYGSDPKIFANTVLLGRLPKERAEGCAAEYEALKYAFHKLISPYVDQARRRKALSRIRFNWNPLVPSTGGLDAPPLGD